MTTVALLTDFSDKYSPMVVKELRQGLRTKMFGGMMLGVHAILLLITLAGISSTRGQEKEIVNGIIGFVLYLIFPLSGFSALAGEIKANTMDMLVLSRLSAGRIVFGKWAAVVLQSLLLTVSILPYMVARYFFGGADLMTDILFLFQSWLVSAVLTAAVVALSTQKQFWLRALIVAMPLFFSFITPMFLFMFGGSRLRSVSQGESLSALIYILPSCAWLIFALLSIAATRIAPASSLLSVPKRLVNLAALILLPLLQWLVTSNVDQMLLYMILILSSVDALTEQVRPISSVYIPFYRRSIWGRIGRFFLAPGWMHGFLFSLVLVAVSAGIAGYFTNPDAAIQIFFVGCTLWFAALMSQIICFWREEGDYLAGFIGGILILALSTLMVTLLIDSVRLSENFRWVLCVLPTTTFRLVDLTLSYRDLLPTAFICNAAWPLLLSLFAFRAFRKTRAVRQEAKSLVSIS